jgi:8-oxo-dGTP pyrophosphatase MutT (NUDIX family)
VTTRDFHLAQWQGLLSEPPTEVAPLRAASTVMLLQDGDQGLEVFVMRRASTMAFAPQMHVFPGGGVDARDTTDELPWAGPAVDEWSALMECDDDTVRGFIAAAAREVFEETGVLLAGPDDGSDPVAALGGPEAAARLRQALVAREISFREVLEDAGLRLRSDLLTYRAHWVTPEVEPRRYDTRFFLAEVPPGQEPDGDTGEADEVAWVRPADLIDAGERGEAQLMPPTLVCLEQLAETSTVSQAMAARPAIATVMPVLVETEAGPAMRAELP